jgi:hypothetical protein
MIVQVQGASAGVLVTEYHLTGQSSQVQIQLDRIDNLADALTKTPVASTAVPNSLATNPVSQAPITSDIEGIDLELLGHIAYKGDVRVRNAWLGDPNGNRQLEGFAISGANFPSGLTLAYSSAGPGDTKPQAVIMGNFVGTRQKAKPITKLAFNMGGPQASNFTLSGQAVFAGQAPLAIVPGQELSGPTGSEPLVAIKLQIAEKIASSPWDDPAITQIFRSS